MRPEGLQSKIFLDGADPEETREIIQLLGFLDGQTTNPTLLSKNPDVKAKCEEEGCSKLDIYEMYQEVVEEISELIPTGSVSVEVYSDSDTKAEEMFNEAQELNEWIPNAHIKFPVTKEGLEAAKLAVENDIKVNMTLVFSMEQAAAVYGATKSASKGDVFISPFIGRLDDIGENGMDLIDNIINLYKSGDEHVEVLSASVRTMEHFYKAMELQSDIITAPYKILKQWADDGFLLKGKEYNPDLKSIKYQELDLNKNWQDFDIKHELTNKGIEKFSADWNNLINK